MKINYIQISNILSFKYYENINEVPKIIFNNDLNILIGQNGSGKSTLLEVINFIFKKVLFVEITFNQTQYNNIATIDLNQKKDILLKPNKTVIKDFRLDPNWDSVTRDQKIRVEVELDEIDDANIANLVIHYDKLKKISEMYSRVNLDTSNSNGKTITLDVSLDHINNNFSANIDSNSTIFGYNYLQHYNLYKELIILHNKENPDDIIPLLHDSFILIGGYRNYHNFNPTLSLQTPAATQFQEIRNKEFVRSINASEQSEPSIFNIVRLYVAEKHFDLFGTKLDEEECEREANKLPILISINKKLNLINLKCNIRLSEKRIWGYSFEFYDTKKDRILNNINSLSAGQKAIVHLIFEAYGRNDIKGGVVVIDEPEIHLHYQFQSEYLRIIKEINKEQKCQYILVTHSESLINSETIGKIKRFALDQNNFTVIKSPNLPDQKTFVKILDNTRSTYAFFSKKIILVEGDTDRYFYKAVLQLLYPDLIQEVAILDIGGKGNFEKWKSFFESYGLIVYYIGDFDNVCTLDFSGSTLIDKKIKAQAEDELKQAKLNNLDLSQKKRFKDAYDHLIINPNFLEKPDRSAWKKLLDIFIGFTKTSNTELSLKVQSMSTDIHTKIETKYQDKIYILKKGSIENYINTSHGDMSAVIKFCDEELQSWLSTEGEESFEIKCIFQKISES